MVEELDQDRILDEHIQVVREQAFHMKKSLDQNNLRDALKFSSTMLGEMKTSRLSPRNYFNLCKSIIREMVICNVSHCTKIYIDTQFFTFRHDGVWRTCSSWVSLYRRAKKRSQDGRFVRISVARWLSHSTPVPASHGGCCIRQDQGSCCQTHLERFTRHG